MAVSVLGSAATVACVAMTASVWWLAGVLMVLSNVCYGATFVFYNGYLPLLTAAHWLVSKATPANRDRVSKQVQDDMSVRGFAAGYAATVCVLLVCTAITFVVDGDTAFRVSIAIAGLWWFSLSLVSLSGLRQRPGPPLPEGSKYWNLGVKRSECSAPPKWSPPPRRPHPWPPQRGPPCAVPATSPRWLASSSRGSSTRTRST